MKSYQLFISWYCNFVDAILVFQQNNIPIESFNTETNSITVTVEDHQYVQFVSRNAYVEEYFEVTTNPKSLNII